MWTLYDPPEEDRDQTPEPDGPELVAAPDAPSLSGCPSCAARLLDDCRCEP